MTVNPSIPKAASILLDFISGPESGGDYDVLYGHHERGLTTPITSMTINALLSAQIGWGHQWGSSAAGRYQIVQTTLAGLLRETPGFGALMFGPGVQDQLAYRLLQRRGFDDFMSGKLDRTAFARNLAQEWASLPVLISTQGAHRIVDAGQSYYAGDGINKALVTTAAFEAALTLAHASSVGAVPYPPLPTPPNQTHPAPAPALTGWQAILARVIAAIVSLFKRKV